MSVSRLNRALLRCITDDGFAHIGQFEIADSVFHYTITDTAASEWVFSVYAWVSVVGEGLVLRIGKCEGPLKIRLAAYKRSLDGVMSGRLGPNEYFKGDTQPWERDGWNYYAGSPGAGLVFAKQVISSTANESKSAALTNCEHGLIKKYDPILCGVSLAGRSAKRSWVGRHGPAHPISKRAQGQGLSR